MAKRVSGVFGFITNSSSAILHFPIAILEHPRVKQFMDVYDIHAGYIGENMWHRSHCESLAITPAQKHELVAKLRADAYDPEYSYGPSVDTDEGSVVLIYGDEYPGLTMTLAGLMRQAADELGLDVSWNEYN